jgi:hypothetical protein
VDSLDLEDTINARYWNVQPFRDKVNHTLRLSDIDAAEQSALFFAGDHGTM